MVNTIRMYDDHGRDFHPLTDHMTMLRNYSKGEIPDFSAFEILHQLMFDEMLSNLKGYLIISQKSSHNSFTNELACCSGY